MRLVACLVLVAAAAAAAAAPAPSTEPQNVKAARINAQLAVAYLKENEVSVALEKIEKALGQNSHDAAVQLSAGLVYERLNDLDKADHHYAEALRLEPHNPDMMNNYAVYLCRHDHHAQGQKLFEQAARNPAYQTPEVALSNAGTCARSAKDLPRAEDLFRKALAARPDYPDALLQLADLSFERGQGLAARGLLTRYFAVSPASPESLWLGIRVERTLGDAQTAERYASQLLKDFPDSDQARQVRNGPVGQ
ncbi:MAG: type IV pilus biogenesis/stability protein PilW [Proteobacteria bacterium]|nr:type IV pilus biogenesis/stability protein PilW [Pseudomonadota bacterium]